MDLLDKKIEGLISCLIPCYNVDNYLEACLQSIEKQTYRKLELIFIDDGSCDATYSILLNFKETQTELFYDVVIEKHEKNRGICAAINTGLNHVHGEFICWFDADDLLDEKCMEKKVDYLINNPQIQCVMARGDIFDNNDVNCVVGSLGDESPVGNMFENYLLQYCATSSGLNMTYSNILLEVLPNHRLREDVTEQNWYIMLLLASSIEIGLMKDVLYHYRLNRESDSHKHPLTTGFQHKKFWDSVDRIRFYAITDSRFSYSYKCRCYGLQKMISIINRLRTIDEEQISDDKVYVEYIIREFLKQGHIQNNINDRKVYLWGSSKRQKLIGRMLSNYVEIEGYIDSYREDAEDGVISGAKICCCDMYIIITLNYHQEILHLLEEKGFVTNRDYYYPMADIYYDVRDFGSFKFMEI